MNNTLNKPDVYSKLNELNVQLPPAPGDGDFLRMIRPFGANMLYLSGTGSTVANTTPLAGHIPSDISLEEGIQAARNCVLNALSALHAYTGDLNRIKSFVKLLAFVSSEADFCDQHIVVNGASRFLIDVFGEEIGKSARSAVGVSSLPNDFPVEIEMIVELDN